MCILAYLTMQQVVCHINYQFNFSISNVDFFAEAVFYEYKLILKFIHLFDITI